MSGWPISTKSLLEQKNHFKDVIWDGNNVKNQKRTAVLAGDPIRIGWMVLALLLLKCKNNVIKITNFDTYEDRTHYLFYYFRYGKNLTKLVLIKVKN